MPDRLTSIVAIDRNGAIGCQNRLPWSIKSDLRFFKKTTLDHSIIMGRKTFESIGGPLKGRRNLVLSHNAVLFSSTPECALVLSVAETLAVSQGSETFVIGGAATYSAFAPLVDRYIVSIVDHVAHGADAFLADEIRDEFSAWPTRELGSFPAQAGLDEFGFRILEFLAPDAVERNEHRKAIANQYLAKRLNSVPPRVRNRSIKDRVGQSAFAF